VLAAGVVLFAAGGAAAKDKSTLADEEVCIPKAVEDKVTTCPGGIKMGDFKTKPKATKLKTLTLCGSGREFKAGTDRGRVLAEANLFARDLQNAPGNMMRPRDLAAAARKLAAGRSRVSCRVLTRPQLKQLGMGALLGVSAGSSEPPVLIHLTYKPKGRSKGRVAFVGKGLTFDAGGISLKPSAKMWDMKYDMSGGAAVLGAFHALRSLDVPFEVHGLVPASENLPDGTATKPGDLLKAMDGTTIEVLNTDAEGRLILCDALAYCVSKVKPDTIIDLATLTGAVVMAVGHEYSGLFATTEALRDGLRKAGDAVGEKVWPLPLEEFHKDWMKGEVGDLKNINAPDQGAGSTAGAAFLWHFVGKTEWAHLDIAGAAWGGMNRDWVGGPQGSGVGARLLAQYLMDRA
jgi:leucyl aminopeptidase